MTALITKAQYRKLFAILGQLGITDRTHRLRACSVITMREISSTSDLTKDEAGQVIDRMEKLSEGSEAAIAEAREWLIVHSEPTAA